MTFESLLARAGVPNDHSKLEEYYEGTMSLDALGVSLPPQVRVLEMAAPFPRMAVDVLAESLTPEGYLLGADTETPALLRRWWQANNMDTQARMGIVEALVQGAAYWIVGPGTADVPRITVHRGVGMAVAYDYMGQVSEGLRRYVVGDTRYAAHYLPGLTRQYVYGQGRWTLASEQGTGLSRPAVVPMLNRVRLHDSRGRSELREVLKMTDAASRSLTNLQVAQELLAMPVRYLFGDGLQAMKDQNGNPVDKITAYFGHFLTGPSGSSAGQIPGADLAQIINSYKLYAQVVASITGIPPTMMGITTDNPASADAMRVAKDRLIARAEVKASLFGDALEEVARLALELMGKTPQGVETLELQWRDPATASQSAVTASLLQAHAQGVISAETARDGLRLTPEQKAREAATSGVQSVIRTQLGA